MNITDVYPMDLEMVVVVGGEGDQRFLGSGKWVPKSSFPFDNKLRSYY